jgi:hypothetical protein
MMDKACFDTGHIELNLETAIARLLPIEMSHLFEGYSGLMLHQMDECATFCRPFGVIAPPCMEWPCRVSPLQCTSAFVRTDRTAADSMLSEISVPP